MSPATHVRTPRGAEIQQERARRRPINIELDRPRRQVLHSARGRGRLHRRRGDEQKEEHGGVDVERERGGEEGKEGYREGKGGEKGRGRGRGGEKGRGRGDGADALCATQSG